MPRSWVHFSALLFMSLMWYVNEREFACFLSFNFFMAAIASLFIHSFSPKRMFMWSRISIIWALTRKNISLAVIFGSGVCVCTSVCCFFPRHPCIRARNVCASTYITHMKYVIFRRKITISTLIVDVSIRFQRRIWRNVLRLPQSKNSDLCGKRHRVHFESICLSASHFYCIWSCNDRDRKRARAMM